MGKLHYVGKLLLALIVIGFLALVIQYADTIRGTVSHIFAAKSVKGARIGFEKEIKENLKEYANSAKDQLMKVKISDIVNGVLRVRKIGKDIGNVKEYVVKEAGNIIKR
jgi:hypothetical protein